MPGQRVAEGDADDRALAACVADADDARVVAVGAAVAVTDDAGLDVEAEGEGVVAAEADGLGLGDVTVRGVVGGVHAALDGGGALGDEPGQGLAGVGPGQAPARDGHALAVDQATGGGDVDREARCAGRRGGEEDESRGRAGPRRRRRQRLPSTGPSDDLRVLSRPRVLPENESSHRGEAARARPSWSGEGSVPPGRSANLNIHSIGGGVIGNTTGSGPVIEGSSPSPRASATLRLLSRTSPLGPIV